MTSRERDILKKDFDAIFARVSFIQNREHLMYPTILWTNYCT